MNNGLSFCITKKMGRSTIGPFTGGTVHLQQCLTRAVFAKESFCGMYRQTCNIRSTKTQNINVSRLDLQLSLRNLMEPGV